MAELGVKEIGVAGRESAELWSAVCNELSIYFDLQVANGGVGIAYCDFWKCARWCVRVVARGGEVNGSEFRELVHACARLAPLIVGSEDYCGFVGEGLCGCGGEFCRRKASVVDSSDVDSPVGSKVGRVVLPVVGSAGGVSDKNSDGSSVCEKVTQKGKNWKKNLKKRLKKRSDFSRGASGESSAAVSVSDRGGEKSELVSSFEKRRIAENKLAAQKAEYQFKKNEYMTQSRVTELQWETERLTCDQKLQKISEARLGSKPGFAETLVSANISSTSLPSMSQGTLSPDSSISVAEVNKMFKLIEDLTAQVVQLNVESKAMKETAVLSAYEQRKLEMENMTFEQIAALRGTEKDIRPDGSPVKYDAIGQEIYSECGRPDFMNQYDYRSSITVSEDGQ